MRHVIAVVALAMSSAAMAGTDHLELVRNTPCLEQYRAWVFSRSNADFTPPEAFTGEQCNAAKAVHERIQEEQYQEQQRLNAAAEAAKERREEAVRAATDRERREATARAKKPGVRLGMTPAQVIAESHWGRPESVNRTTTAAGVTEQWVYGGRNYLYFTNGRLSAIQN